MMQRRKDLQRGTPTERGYGPPWQRARKAVLRLQPYCVICGTEGDRVNPLTVDHIVPKAHGGTDDDANLRTLCRRCNGREGAQVRGRSKV